MKIKKVFLAGAAVAGLALTAVPSAAQAAEAGPSPKGEVGAGATGKLYAWDEPHKGGGEPCAWDKSEPNWGSSWWGCADWASSLHNDGYPGKLDDVWLYRDTGFSGPRRGIHNGTYLADLGPINYDGTGESLNNTISSHKWTDL